MSTTTITAYVAVDSNGDYGIGKDTDDAVGNFTPTEGPIRVFVLSFEVPTPAEEHLHVKGTIADPAADPTTLVISEEQQDD